MLRMFAHLVCLLVLVSAQRAAAHGTAINLFLQEPCNQIAVFPGFESGVINPAGGSVLFTDSPGFSVSSPVNGIPSRTELWLNVLEGLLYWDGSGLATSETQLTVVVPNIVGPSPVKQYDVTSSSGYQNNMFWGTYEPPADEEFWDAHGVYLLDDETAQPGVYGLVLQLAAPGLVASDPILLPLVYDPQEQWGVTELATARSLLEEAVTPLTGADFNRDSLVDSADLAIWQVHFGAAQNGLHACGDADGDGDVDGHDFLAWQRGNQQGATSLLAIPEPSTALLSLLASVLSGCKRSRCQRI